MGTKKHYKPGSFYRIDDKSGFAFRAEETRKEWTGAVVADRYFEPRQPQDLVRGVRDDQTVPDPRPRQVNRFVILPAFLASSPFLAGSDYLASSGADASSSVMP